MTARDEMIALIVKAIREAERCPRFIPEEPGYEGCDGLEGCTACLFAAAADVGELVL
jgi:hypothetical protein